MTDPIAYRVNATRDGPWRMLHVPALDDYVDACGSPRSDRPVRARGSCAQT